MEMIILGQSNFNTPCCAHVRTALSILKGECAQTVQVGFVALLGLMTRRLLSYNAVWLLECIATMKRLSVLAILPFMMGCSADEQNVATGLSPDANPWPKPYQAVFSVPAGSATLEERRYSDGNGRIRVDVPFDDSRRSINVYNIAKKERLGWTEGTGEYLIEPLKLDELPHFNAERLQAMAAQSLGEKIIDGHSCCGFGGPQGEVWVDSRFGIPVLSTTGGASIKLVSLSETPPDPSLFEIPSGYHKMQTSQ